MLKRCPQCEYLLTGLPPDHACPECGLRYDRASRMYRQSANSALYTGISGVAVFWVVSLLRQAREFTGLGRTILLVLWSLLVVGLVVASFYLYRLVRRGRFLCALPDGILVRQHSLKCKFTPWTNVSQVSLTPGSLGANLWTRDNRRLANLIGFFRSKAEVEEFVRYANSRIGASGSESSGRTLAAMDEMGRSPRPPAQILKVVALPSFREPRDLPYVAIVLLLVLAGFFIAQLGVRWLANALLAASALTFVAGAAWRHTGPKTAQRVVITEAGVMFQRGDDELFSCRWHDFEQAQASGSSLSIRGRFGARLFMVPVAYFGRAKEVAALAKDINDFKASQSERTRG